MGIAARPSIISFFPCRSPMLGERNVVYVVFIIELESLENLENLEFCCLILF